MNMASVTNPVQCPVRTSGFSSFYLRPIRISPSVVALKSRSVASRAFSGGLAFSPLPEKNVKACNNKSVEAFSDKFLGFSAWNQRLRRRGSAEFPVVKAAAADSEGREIEISDGLDSLSLSLFAFLL